MWHKKSCSSKKELNEEPQRESDSPVLQEPRKFLDNCSKQVNPPGQNKGKDELQAFDQQMVVYHESQTNASSDWMSQLKKDSVQFLAEQRGVQLKEIYQESLLKQGLESLIDRIYGIMQGYSSEFNQVAGGTDLHVSSTISGDVREVTRYNIFREVEETQTYSRARFSTRILSLILRGHDDTIEFYIIPTNKVMALSKYENEFKPIALIKVKVTDQGVMWRMLDGIPAVDSLEELSMWLFTNLIQQSKEAANEEEEVTG